MENPLEVWVGALLHHPLGQRKNHLVDPEHDNASHWPDPLSKSVPIRDAAEP